MMSVLKFLLFRDTFFCKWYTLSISRMRVWYAKVRILERGRRRRRIRETREFLNNNNSVVVIIF